MGLSKEVIYERRRCQPTSRSAQLTHSMGLFKFLNWDHSKDTLKSLFNRPKIISCQKWTIRVRIWAMATSERSKLLNRSLK